MQKDGDSAASARLGAFAVHILTASGAGLALMALFAATNRDWAGVFGWLGAALIVDGVDGALARHLNVNGVLPRWSGETLDFVVDFTTYVFVPAYALAISGLLPDALAVPLAVLVVMTSALYFSDRNMKTDGNYFMGFPALWNAVSFYLFLLKPAPWIGASVISALLIATFLPIPFIHPVRVTRWRWMNILCLVVWAALALVALAANLEPAPWVTLGLCGIGLYLLASGLVPSRKTERA